jgi:hypothetical protein
MQRRDGAVSHRWSEPMPEPDHAAAAESAATVLSDLEVKAEDSRRRGDEIGMKRRDLAYAAHTGDAKAKKQLDTLNDEGARILLERQDLDVALLTARSRLAEAQRVAAGAEEQAALELLPPITKRIRERAARLDTLAGEMVRQATALRADFDELHRADFPRPQTQLIITGARRAAQSAFISSILENERIPPNERHTFAYLAEAWTAGVEREIAGRLGRPLDMVA